MKVPFEERLDTRQTIELAEGVEIRLRIAGPFLRLFAFMIDSVIQGVVMSVVSGILMAGGIFVGMAVAQGVLLLVSFAMTWFYFVFFEAGAKGATPGKRMVGLRVVSESGARLTLGQSMMRNFIRVADLMLPILALVPFLNKRFQRLGDLAAGTLVIYAKETLPPVSLGPPALKSVPIPVPLLREEEAAILSFRDRSASWSEERRLEMTSHLKPLTHKEGLRSLETVFGMARWLDHRG